MYTLQELESILRGADADFALLRQETPILSTDDAKAYYDIAKAAPTFILQSEAGLVACIVSARRGRLDLEALKAKFGFSRLRMADRKKILAQTGCDVGAIPLVGHGLDCIFDDTLLEHDYIYGGTGDPLTTLQISPHDAKRLNHITGIL